MNVQFSGQKGINKEVGHNRKNPLKGRQHYQDVKAAGNRFAERIAALPDEVGIIYGRPYKQDQLDLIIDPKDGYSLGGEPIKRKRFESIEHLWLRGIRKAEEIVAQVGAENLRMPYLLFPEVRQDPSLLRNWRESNIEYF